jgi:hypothetical protein
MTQEDFAQKLEMCEISYTEKMQNMHLSLEEKAVEESARIKARLLDAVRMHYQKVQAMTVMRFFSKWRQTIVLDKSNKECLEVIVSSHHISPHFISSHLISSPLIFPQLTLCLIILSRLIPYSFIVSYERHNPFSSFLFFRILYRLSYLVL